MINDGKMSSQRPGFATAKGAIANLTNGELFMFMPAEDLGLCLDLPAGDTSNGNAVWLWECDDGLESQAWLFDPDSWQITLAQDPGKCVGVPGDQFYNGNQLHVWDCSEVDGQRWGYNPEQQTIYTAASYDVKMCIDVPEAEYAAGQWLQIWDCNDGQSSQHFAMQMLAPSESSPSPSPSSGPSVPWPSPSLPSLDGPELCLTRVQGVEGSDENLLFCQCDDPTCHIGSEGLTLLNDWELSMTQLRMSDGCLVAVQSTFNSNGEDLGLAYTLMYATDDMASMFGGCVDGIVIDESGYWLMNSKLNPGSLACMGMTDQSWPVLIECESADAAACYEEGITLSDDIYVQCEPRWKPQQQHWMAPSKRHGQGSHGQGSHGHGKHGRERHRHDTQ